MSFCTSPLVCKKCGKPLTMFEGWTCLECDKAEQEPCEDAISRQAVIKVLINNGVHFCDMVKITSDIKDLPPVNPQEPKTGYWIDVDGLWFKCSKCDAHRKMMPAYKEYYCPNCGARMESEE